MIPTFNCAAYLGETLDSLRGQGVEAAQIEVVDDCSTRDDPESVVARAGLDGVTFHRQPSNLGMVGNFNSCLERAERPWVHILHGDDHMLPGGYARLGQVIEELPASEVVMGRCVMTDEQGTWEAVTSPTGDAHHGPAVYDPYDWRLNRLQFAGVAFRRDAALRVGGFDARYAHCADWHLWWRLAKHARTSYTNECVGVYRRFSGSHTSSLIRSAGNLREGLALVHEIATAEPQVGVDIYRALFGLAVDQARRNAADGAAVVAHARLLLAFPRGLPRARRAARLAVSHAMARARGRVGHEWDA